MRITGLVFGVALIFAAAAMPATAAEQTWTGRISDSHCGMVHNSDVEHGGKITARECVVGRDGDPSIPGCVSAKNGAKFVLVIGQKIYQVSNQGFAGLRVHAEHPNVRIKGELKGDTITVTDISMPKS